MTALVAVTLLLAAAVAVQVRRDLRDAEYRRRIRAAMRAARERDPFYRLGLAFGQITQKMRKLGHAARRAGTIWPFVVHYEKPEPHRWFYPSDPAPCRCALCVAHRRMPS